MPTHGTVPKTAMQQLKDEVKPIIKLSFYFCLLWFTSNYFYNFGLSYASITSSVVLSNTSPVWVYLLGLSCFMPAALRETFSFLKAGMVLLSLMGFVLIAIEDWKSTDE